jgi:hypothetical protein
MQTYLLLFRASYAEIEKTSPEEMQRRNATWMDWLNAISAEGKLAGGNHLGNDGYVVKADGVVEKGTFAETGVSVLGYILVKTETYDEALLIAKDCPILAGKDNSVEVRALHAM